MTSIKLDILAFGAHADDVEIGMGGTIAKYTSMGKSVGICDLTKAELSSNGTVDQRREEARAAAEVLGVSVRETLDLPDRGIQVSDNHIKAVAAVIRRYRPKIIFTPYSEDRHPDHGNCARLVREAVFSAGIRKYDAGEGLEPHKASAIYHYFINGLSKPDFLIDISPYFWLKQKSLEAYGSQFIKKEGSADTPLTEGYVESVEARERLFGKTAGVKYAEGFMAGSPLLVYDLLGESV